MTDIDNYIRSLNCNIAIPYFIPKCMFILEVQAKHVAGVGVLGQPMQPSVFIR